MARIHRLGACVIALVAVVLVSCGPPPKPIVREYDISKWDAQVAQSTALYTLKSAADDKLNRLWLLLPDERRTDLEGDWAAEKLRIKTIVRGDAQPQASRDFVEAYQKARNIYPELPAIESVDDVDRISTELAFRTHLLNHTLAQGFFDPRIQREFIGDLQLDRISFQGQEATAIFIKNGNIRCRLTLEQHKSGWTYRSFEVIDQDEAAKWFERYFKRNAPKKRSPNEASTTS